MSRKKIIIIILVIVLAVLAVGMFMAKNFAKGNEGTVVETSAITATAITEKVSATGKVQPEIEVKISSEVSGEIIDLPVVEGQVVEKGQLLVRINPDLYQSAIDRTVASLSTARANLNQAEAQLNEAKYNYDRNQVLLDKGVISRAEWEKIESSFEVAKASKNSAYYNVQAAQATVTEARDNMNRTAIYAPASGTISKLDVELGERVLGTQQMTGTELMRIANLNNMEVEVDVNENDIVKIAVGNKAVIEVDAYLKKKFEGTVTSISNSADETLTADQVTNFKVKVKIDKSSYQDLVEGKPATYSPFRPGMTATVDIISSEKSGILAVPIGAIIMHQEEGADTRKEAVFVKNGDVAEIKYVQTGIQDDKNIEIISGLKSGDEVITGPYSTVSKTLKPGTKVTVKNNTTTTENEQK